MVLSMPNGATKNWTRLCVTIDGFRACHKSWPSRIHIGKIEYSSLKEVFLPETFNLLERKLEFFIEQELGMSAVDGRGRKFDYGESGFPSTSPGISASEWLGVGPDSPLAID